MHHNDDDDDDVDADTIIYSVNYKTYNGFKYHLNFPNQWIFYELPHTGRECGNCVGSPEYRRGYAMWRGIILGYCGNCADAYRGARCRGFNGYATEFTHQYYYESAYDRYLGHINLENFGDIEANPDDTIVIQSYK